MTLNTGPNLTDVDDIIADLLAAHRGLSPEQSLVLNAQLVLILANHIGDRAVISEALALAREAG